MGVYAQRMSSEEISEWRRKRLALIVEEMGSSRALGEAIGHSSGEQIRGMLAGMRPLTDKSMDKIEALPGRRGWFGRYDAMPDGRDLVSCLRYIRQGLELLTPANRQVARIALKHFIDSPDELLEVAQVLQKLADES
jgi:hypothetical protein